MNSQPDRHPSAARGQSLVELALMLMIILLLLTGAVEFSLGLFQYVTIRDAAQEGALYGSIKPTDVAGMKLRARQAAEDVVSLNTGDVNDPASGDIKITYYGSQCEGLTDGVPHSITVTITFAHPITMPFIGEWVGDTINLTGRVTDTILQPVCPS